MPRTWTPRSTPGGRPWTSPRPATPTSPGTCRTSAAPCAARFERAGDAADLDAAIDAGRQAVDLTPPGHPDLAVYLSNLGVPCAPGSSGPGTPRTWTPRSTPAGRPPTSPRPATPTCPAILSNLGSSLLSRFERAGDAADLDAAIDAGQQAVDLTPPGHPDLAVYLSNLGISLHTRFERAGDTADLDAAIELLAARQPGADRDTQLSGWPPRRAWGAAAADAGRTHEAAEGYAAAVGLLPAVAWHGLDRATREEQLAQWAGLAADAAACAVLDGRPELAVELLEQGRSVLWSQALNLRSDLTRLAEQAPDLAARLDSIRAILDSPLPEATPPAGQNRQRHRAGRGPLPASSRMRSSCAGARPGNGTRSWPRSGHWTGSSISSPPSRTRNWQPQPRTDRSSSSTRAATAATP